MTPLRAFVGHSFTDDDAEVIGKFLKYLGQLAELYPSFSWEHAEPAEPKVLAEKVKRLLAGKNLFIGICTKKERVISPSALSPTLFPGKRFKAREEDFYWKTSDWIIQEIGLAIGLGLHVMLLVEQGLRSPGGLQGNLEYTLSLHKFPLAVDLRRLAVRRGNATTPLGPPDWRTY